ncbi:MAG: DUF4129 domain-containing protein [Gemmataceae bacterium]|nr:DUF4129 domain-containing protein [Gemmataceae bacterium]
MTVPAEAVRAKSADVFARPEFNPEANALNFDWVAKFFRWLGTLSSNAPGLYWVILISCIALLVVLVAHLSYTVYRALTYRTETASAARAERLRRSAAFFAQAEQHANAGAFTEAIRHLFLALVFRFDEAGRVALRPGATNREYLINLEADPRVHDALGRYVDLLDDYWYARREASQPQYAECRGIYDRVTG